MINKKKLFSTKEPGLYRIGNTGFGDYKIGYLYIGGIEYKQWSNKWGDPFVYVVLKNCWVIYQSYNGWRFSKSEKDEISTSLKYDGGGIEGSTYELSREDLDKKYPGGFVIKDIGNNRKLKAKITTCSIFFKSGSNRRATEVKAIDLQPVNTEEYNNIIEGIFST